MNQLLSASPYTLKIYLPPGGRIVFPVTDLMFIPATGNYSWLHWNDGQRILLSRTLKYYEPQLPDGWFVRPHRSCLVTIHYIERMEYLYRDKGGLLHLRSGAVLPVSRRRWEAIREIIQSLPIWTDGSQWQQAYPDA